MPDVAKCHRPNPPRCVDGLYASHKKGTKDTINDISCNMFGSSERTVSDRYRVVFRCSNYVLRNTETLPKMVAGFF